MFKNIILLSDGTGNSNIKDRGTNVFKLYEALDFNNYNQVAFYDDGVGTQEFKPLKIMGGAFGWGLSRNIRQLYKELVQTYEPGDKIYLFGFSRGAFTVRRLAGLICEMGILDKSIYQGEQLDNAIWHLFRKYRAKKPALLEPCYEPIIDVLAKYIYKLDNEIHFNADDKVEIKVGFKTQVCNAVEFIGVWDTVAAIGLPFEEITDIWDALFFRFKFHDHKLSKHVSKAYHALSIDDERQSFHPLLWENDNSRIEQVWFPGVHSNVGGGYPQQGLSLVALQWMIEKATAAKLKFIKTDARFIDNKKYDFDKLYNSRAGLGAWYRYKPRYIAEICAVEKIVTPQIHLSVFNRIAQGVCDYAPGNIPNIFEVVDNQGCCTESANIVKLLNTSINSMPPPTLPQAVLQILSLGVYNVLKNNNSSNASSLLHRAALPILARRVLHFVLLVFSLIILYWLVFGGQPSVNVDIDTWKALASADGLLDRVLALFWKHKIFIVVAAIIFGCTWRIRKNTERLFLEFWSDLRSNLDKFIMDHNVNNLH